ncbi:unnamed protein product [Adineta steineri]|uniref:G-protein coupled receptors family 1 profile domain-containing protein n=1 Tax=Adineta steineri TaxID=433720 RepID=A0A813SPF4_9BILA|nr:unnamed protein product [Adineta steineri]CAF1383822.1 unnamed protein product [Adineta steineri]CAF1608552.1 unnamed protein product [Adineta steineri]
MNITAIDTSSENYDSFIKYMRSINFILSCTGLLFNFFLIIILLLIGRRQCATYFLLILMTICDFLYCTVYVSIVLTVDQYINIINHEILCPLSFFLTPFTFTGSTLLLFICLIHFITNYVRRYDTVLGQIGGPLSVVFVLAFIIIRSVLGSTSVELIILDPNVPKMRFCTIDMNTPPIVATVQHINHIFAEVTDILVYIGWIIVLIIYLINLICCKKSSFCTQTELNTSSSMPKPLSFTSLLVHNNNIINHEQNTLSMTLELSDILNLTNEIILTNKQRHHDVSLIIISTSIISVIFYLPIMISKYSTMYSVYREQTFLTDDQAFFLQILQHTAHLFCLSIKFLPYLIFDKRIHLFINQLIGIKCMKIQRRKTLSRRRRYQIKQKYIFHCQCYRRPQVLDFNNHNEGEQ